MNHVISTSCGNDSVAMILRVAELREEAPDLFKDDTWHAVYCDTGWAKDGWDKRVDMTKALCEELDIEFHVLVTDVRNKKRVSSVDKTFGVMDDKNSLGMLGLIRKNTMFPNLSMKFCTVGLKINAIGSFNERMGFDRLNTTQWVGLRREEGGRLGKNSPKDRSNTTSYEECSPITGFPVVYPIAYMTQEQEYELLTRNNVDIYPNRSDECYPCIFQSGKKDLAGLDDARVDLIEDMENKLTRYKKARFDLMGREYDHDKIWGMFNFKTCGGNMGIRAQVEWAKRELGNKAGDQGDLFDIIDDKCDSGYCGL